MKRILSDVETILKVSGIARCPLPPLAKDKLCHSLAIDITNYYSDLIQQARQEVARELIPLIDKLFEALDHADFSNGIEANGVDEGRVMASQHTGELYREYLSLKSKYRGKKK